MRIVLFLLAAIVLSSRSSAREGRLTTEPPAKRTPRLGFTPFRDIRVLDNRPDSTIYTAVGRKGAVQYFFGNRMADSVRNYLKGKLAGMRKGDETLLIDIDELRIPNLPWVLRQGPGDSTVCRWFDNGFQVSATLYETTASGSTDRYRKICSTNTCFFAKGNTRIGQHHPDKCLHWLLDCLLIAATRGSGASMPPPHGWADKLKTSLAEERFTYPKDSTVLTTTAINRPATEKWKEDAVMRQPPDQDGVYHNFDDFRSGTLRPEKLAMQFNASDSSFTLSPERKDHSWPWAVAFEGNLYIDLGFTRNKYLRLDRREGSYYFHIPRSMPDMGSYIALEKLGGGSDFSGGSIGPYAGDILGAGVIAAIVRSAVIGAKVSEITEKGMKRGDLRTCYIDMNCGDIIYY
jgi:hypothetical protein